MVLPFSSVIEFDILCPFPDCFSNILIAFRNNQKLNFLAIQSFDMLEPHLIPLLFSHEILKKQKTVIKYFSRRKPICNKTQQIVKKGRKDKTICFH